MCLALVAFMALAFMAFMAFMGFAFFIAIGVAGAIEQNVIQGLEN